MPTDRYMPDPTLPPLLSTPECIASVRDEMPALANEIRKWLSLRGPSLQDINMLMAVDSGNDVGLDGQLNDGAVAYFEAKVAIMEAAASLTDDISTTNEEVFKKRRPFHPRASPWRSAACDAAVQTLRDAPDHAHRKVAHARLRVPSQEFPPDLTSRMPREAAGKGSCEAHLQ